MAQDVLERGDSVLARHSAGQTYTQAAQALGVTPDQAKKAARLARAFGPEQRHQIGRDVLCHLTAAHLEAAARHPNVDTRVNLTLGAHADGTSSRKLQATVALLLGTGPSGTKSCRSEYNLRTFSGDFDSVAEAAEALVHRGDSGLGIYIAGQRGRGLLRLCSVMKTLIPMIDELGANPEQYRT
ncbi:hypothetical protein [Streptosporangium lutulentum]|uniref:Transcriptional regulator n=1 Tax=Streptosporangium lutulentum TaxID=1461250 RepID=A0ABT9QRT4_9ACTN|nr:hypothetical protein [Streptosporangium lutulentum]MDP9848649.1 hypothetical protein [Streptosporangium lutulentum]